MASRRSKSPASPLLHLSMYSSSSKSSTELSQGGLSPFSWQDEGIVVVVDRAMVVDVVVWIVVVVTVLVVPNIVVVVVDGIVVVDVI